MPIPSAVLKSLNAKVSAVGVAPAKPLAGKEALLAKLAIQVKLADDANYKPAGKTRKQTAWFAVHADKSVSVEIRYGRSRLPLNSKGATTLKLPTSDNPKKTVKEFYTQAVTWVNDGDFDADISKASDDLRDTLQSGKTTEEEEDSEESAAE